MSERPIVCAALLAVALLGAPHPAAAQSAAHRIAAERAAAERARIDSLLPLLEEANAAAKRRDEQQRQAELTAAGKLDTVRVGPLRIVGRARALDFAMPLAREV